MKKRVRVFLACSFHEKDHEVVEKVEKLLSSRKYNFEVRTAKSPQARGISDKITSLIDWADLTVGLFTKRTEAPAGESVSYVVSECSYALGRYKNNPNKGVYGIVEDGVIRAKLGIPTAAGAEYPGFNRKEFLSKGSRKLEEYFADLYGRFTNLPPSANKYFRQREFRKTIEIYRSGCGVFKNTYTIVVHNPEAILERGNRVQHTIWIPNQSESSFPPFEEMVSTRIPERLTRPVFSSIFLRRGKKAADPKPMKVYLGDQDDKSIRFDLEFPLREVKNNDILHFQYLWSMPGIFHPYEELLGEDAYEEVALRTTYGEIGKARLRVRFERETLQGAVSPPIFSKEPFIQYSITQDENGITTGPEEVSAYRQDATWETFESTRRKLGQAMIMRWRPVSKKNLEKHLDASRFSKVLKARTEKRATGPHRVETEQEQESGS